MTPDADRAARQEGADDAVVRVESVSRAFGETRAVDDVSLEVRRGELLVLLGPSGCGKTTTLRLIAGFEKPDAGRILIEGRDVTDAPPQRRSIGMVFQNYALFPHLDVFENVAFGLKARGAARDEIATRVTEALALVDLTGYETRRVQALSGGQQQRVALARALAPRPPVLLLDEPLSNLDAALRERTRTELRALLHRLGMTAVFVTHDQEEAFALADRIAVMRAGRVEQVGTPEHLYREPVSEFVAGFLGRVNFLDATVARVDPGDGSALCTVAGWDAQWWAAGRPDASAQVGDVVRLMVRPEDLELTPPLDQHASPRVVSRQFVGSTVRYVVEPALPAAAPLVVSARALGFDVGDTVAVAPRMDGSVRWFPVEQNGTALGLG